MSTHDYIIDNAVGATVRADINSALAAIVSNNSSATEPATMYAYQWWADTTTGLLKQRNASNTAWVTKLVLSEGQLALLAGSASQTFSVAAASAAAHAMRWDTPNMASLTVTQATGALTFAGIAHSLTFRSATLTDGAVSTIIADPADLVLPSGGTLGFTSTVQGHIVVAEMNNGGISEYAICNIAGGLKMDETNLISTTAIDTASDAANVWYSTTARTSLPYKIVGYVDVVNTAGAWGNPVLVQAVGGMSRFKSTSMVRLNTANGYGSTNTVIPRFTNTVENLGTAITYADSATAGASFTINEHGRYYIGFDANFNAAASMGISLNSTQLTTAIAIITVSDILSIATAPAANQLGSASVTLQLKPDDVVRPHTSGAAFGTSPVLFTITKVS